MGESVITKQNAYLDRTENQEGPARANRRAELVVVDMWDQFILDGRTFQMQLGTEDAPINTTTSIDDQLVFAVADNPAGLTMIPSFLQLSIATWTTSTLVNMMLEIDRALARYSSGGTAYVPENLRTDRPRTASGTFYVGTDVTVIAKTAVPGSMEIWRHVGSEDNVGTSTGAENANVSRYSAKELGMFAAIVGVGSALVHFGTASADATGYGSFCFVQVPSASVT